MPLRQGAQREAGGKSTNKSLSPNKAYDEHLNLMLSDVEEKITTMDVDPMTKQEQLKVRE